MKTRTMVAVLMVAVASPALAAGILVDGAALEPAQRASLQAAIAQSRTEHPELFDQVRQLPAVAARLDRTKRGGHAPMGKLLRGLGPDASLALAELAAFSAETSGLTPSALLALQLGVADALGHSRDARLVPVLALALARPDVEAKVLRVEAEALASIGTDAALDTLIAAARRESGERQLAVLWGAGKARRLRTTQLVAQTLKQERDPARAEAIAEALGHSANATAWMGIQGPAKSEEGAVRELAARTLVDSFVRFEGSTRQAAEDGLVLVAHPSTASLLQQAERQARPEVRSELMRARERLQR